MYALCRPCLLRPESLNAELTTLGFESRSPAWFCSYVTPGPKPEATSTAQCRLPNLHSTATSELNVREFSHSFASF